MATTPNGIATEKEAYDKLQLSSYPSGYDADKLITKTRVKNRFNGDVYEKGDYTYKNNQCVKYEDILIKLNWYVHNDLVIPETWSKGAKPGEAPDGNIRLDANFVEFDNSNTAKYSYLSTDLFAQFYEYSGTPSLGLEEDWSDADVQFEGAALPNSYLVAISSCGQLVNLDNHTSQLLNLSNTGDDGIFHEFDFVQSAWRSTISDINISNDSGSTKSLGLGEYITIDNKDANVLAVMRSGQQFTVMYKSSEEPKDIIEVATLIALDINASATIGGSGSTILSQVTYVPTNGEEAIISDYSGVTKLFSVTSTYTQHSNLYYLLITFTKTPVKKDIGSYYLVGLVANAETSATVKETVLFKYSRFDSGGSAITPSLWLNTCITSEQHAGETGLDTTALYSINFFDINSGKEKEEMYQELNPGSSLFLKTSCCIVDPLLYNSAGNYWETRPISIRHNFLDSSSYELNFNQIGLSYTRAVESFIISDNATPTSTTTSFIADTALNLLKYISFFNPEEQCYLLFGVTTSSGSTAISTLSEIIADTLGLSSQLVASQLLVVGNLARSSFNNVTWVAVPESLFFDVNATNNAGQIEVSEYPRAITISIPGFGNIMAHAYDSSGCREFYIYYKTHFYHYSIDNSLT